MKWKIYTGRLNLAAILWKWGLYAFRELYRSFQLVSERIIMRLDHYISSDSLYFDSPETNFRNFESKVKLLENFLKVGFFSI